MKALPAVSGVKRLKPGSGVRARSILLLAALSSTALLAQTLEKTIPLGTTGSNLACPWLLAVDSATSTVYVASEEGGSILAIDGAARRRKTSIPFDDDWCSSIFTLPNQGRVYCVGEMLVAAVDVHTNTVVGQVSAPEGYYFLSGSANPYSGKVYLATDESLLVVDGASSQVVRRVWAGCPETDDYDRASLAANTTNGKTYLFSDDDSGRSQLAVIDGAGDTVRASVPLDNNWLMAMCYDDINGLLWCAVETDTATLLLAVDGETDEVVDSIAIDPLFVVALCFAREDNKLYVVSEEQYITVIDAAARLVVDELYVPDGAVAACVNSRAHKLYVGCTECPLAVVDTRRDQWSADIGSFTEPLAMAVCPLTNEVWCADYEADAVTAIDCIGDSVVATVITYVVPTAFCLDAAADRLYIAGLEEYRVDVMDTEHDSMLAPLLLGFEVGAMCLNPAGNRLFCVSVDSGELAVVDVANGQTLYGHDIARARYPAWDTAGSKVYWTSYSNKGTVYSVSGEGGEKLAEIPLTFRPRAAWFDLLRRRLYVAADNDKGITVIDARSESQVAQLPTASRQRHRLLSGSPGMYRLYCASGNAVSIYDTDNYRLIKNLELGAAPQAFCCDDATGRMFCALGNDSIVVLDPVGDTVLARIGVPEPAIAMGYIASSNSVYWAGWTSVGCIDAGALRATGTLKLGELRQFSACDGGEGLIYLLGLSAIYVVHNENPEYSLQSRTGPVFMAREALLYGAKHATLFDITGRTVQTLRPGPNRLVGLPPGAYFLRRDGEARAQKIVITR